MATNTNGDVPSTPESTEKKESGRGGKSSRFFDIFGKILFFAVWIIFGVVIFNHLTSSGTSVVLAALAALVGGFVAAVIVWIVGMSGATF